MEQPHQTKRGKRQEEKIGTAVSKPIEPFTVQAETFNSTLENRLESLHTMLNQITELIDEDDEDDFVYSPSVVAFEQFGNIVRDAYLLSYDVHFIDPIIAPDGAGGLKLDWRKSFTSEVRLYISGRDLNRSYLYYRFGAEDGAIPTPTAHQLAFYLKKLA